MTATPNKGDPENSCRFLALRDREEGQAMVEYALLLSLIAVVSIGILTALGQNVSTIFSSVNSAL